MTLKNTDDIDLFCCCLKLESMKVRLNPLQHGVKQTHNAGGISSPESISAITVSTAATFGE